MITWVEPSLSEEINEINRTVKELNLDKIILLNSFQKGKLINLPFHIWASLENTDSWDEIKFHDIDKAKELALIYQKDFDNLLSAFESGSHIQAPIILMLEDRNPYLISGNTRLMISKALGIKPMVWQINYSN